MGEGGSPSPLHVGIVSKTCFQMPLRLLSYSFSALWGQMVMDPQVLPN